MNHISIVIIDRSKADMIGLTRTKYCITVGHKDVGRDFCVKREPGENPGQSCCRMDGTDLHETTEFSREGVAAVLISESEDLPQLLDQITAQVMGG